VAIIEPPESTRLRRSRSGSQSLFRGQKPNLANGKWRSLRTRSILICSCRLALSAFWWNDLTADFAARIGQGMDVDIPLAGGKLLRLLGRERRLSLNRVFRGAALLAHPHH